MSRELVEKLANEIIEANRLQTEHDRKSQTKATQPPLGAKSKTYAKPINYLARIPSMSRNYVPWANVIFNTGYDNKTLYLRKYNVENELKSTGEDYLFVDSLPPFAAYKNNTLKYQVSCKTNGGSVKYELSEGPKGMKVTADGMLTWRPPRGKPVGLVPVVVTIKSSKGDENIHSFELVVLPDVKKRR